MDPDTPLRSVKYLRKTPKRMPRGCLIKITKPSPEGGGKRGKSVEYNSGAKEANIMEYGDPIPKKKRKKTVQKAQK